MGGQEYKTDKKKICIGLLAHVDAGKTTLAEGLLLTCGEIQRLGRVDHGDACLDNFALERERGITIFSKQARLSWKEMDITLLDTPGHVDFSAEMERTLQVLDYAVLVISGSDGVQGHVETLWRLLKQYQIPVFLFVNKMDQPGTNQESLLAELRGKLDGGCQTFGPDAEKAGDAYWEELALCSEALMEEYLETGDLQEKSLASAIRARQLFPCYFGSALKLNGVEELLEGLRRFCLCTEYPQEFGARVYKISRDDSGVRLTHLKVTGGALRVKMPVDNRASAGVSQEAWEKKVDQLRLYTGGRFNTVDQVEAGGVCAVTGLDRTFAGQGLGRERENLLPVLVPVLSYGLVLPEGSDAVSVLGKMRRLQEEEPLLHVVWKERVQEIQVQVMGEVQIEVLKRMLEDRFGLSVEFADGHVMYRETIARAVVGIGHYEPLRHYAEVHLLLEPGEPGSGLQFASACSEDVLDRNWQGQILTCLEEKTHLGVLTGSPVTDIKVTLLTGRAHLKHTEGGDFRQAACRAFRQGLMQGENLLLEPVLSFSLEIPTGLLGRAMSDVQRFHGRFDPPVTEGERSVLTGSAPAAAMGGYQREVTAYSRGQGRFSAALKGYEPCHDPDQVIEQYAYEPEADLENPSSSVFCAHGAGFVVEWDKVGEYAHLDSGWSTSAQEGAALQGDGRGEAFHGEWTVNGGGASSGGSSAPLARSAGRRKNPGESRSDYITQEEIEEIFLRTYGKGKQDYEPYRYHRQSRGNENNPGQERQGKNGPAGAGEYGGAGPGRKREEYLLVDGYNIIFAWEELRSLAQVNIDSARDKLMDICCNYQGYFGGTLILVFDAYKVKGGLGSVLKYHNIHVVYTKEAETADQYIEKTVHKMGGKHQVAVATSDRLEQMIIWGEGAVRLSAASFQEAVEAASRQVREKCQEGGGGVRNRPFEELL